MLLGKIGATVMREKQNTIATCKVFHIHLGQTLNKCQEMGKNIPTAVM